MKVLVVGGGGREHAITWSLTRNPTIDRLYSAPGNAGISREATTVPIAADDVEGLASFAELQRIDLTIVGPEAPLVAGLVDEFEARGLRAFGPGREAARIEASKAWTKELCERYGIPAARSKAFTRLDPAVEYLDAFSPPYVIKVDGLAAGKGVTVAGSRERAIEALRESLDDRVFGEAGDTVLVEEFLTGREVSAFAITDGRDIFPLVLAQDFKRIGDGDTGPNTGGMGAYSPVPWVDAGTEGRIWDEIVGWSVRAMEAEGVRYRGVLYAGCMLTDDGPKLLEFNCRFGDPEAEAIIPRLRSDLGELLLACVEGNLSNYKVHWAPDACVTLVLASRGYPGRYEVGREILGLDAAAETEGAVVFHSGTKEEDGRVVTAGGRVLAVSGSGATISEARATAYAAAERISFDGMDHRTDIARAAAEEET